MVVPIHVPSQRPLNIGRRFPPVIGISLEVCRHYGLFAASRASSIWPAYSMALSGGGDMVSNNSTSL